MPCAEAGHSVALIYAQVLKKILELFLKAGSIDATGSMFFCKTMERKFHALKIKMKSITL